MVAELASAQQYPRRTIRNFCWLLAELAAEDDFGRAITGSSDKLARPAAALAEHRAGLTEELVPDRL